MSQTATNLRPVTGAGHPAPSAQPAIRIRDLQKTFGALTAVDRVTVDIDSDGSIAHVRQGLGALFPDEDIKGCPLHEGRGPDCPSSLEIGRKNEFVLKSARFQTGLPPDLVNLAARAGD